MIKSKTFFCQQLLILIVSCWALSGHAAIQPNKDISQYEISQTLIGGASVGKQLFKPGLYWNPQRQGWGINITQTSQADGVIQLVAVIFTYRVDGSPIWYLASAPINGSSWNATLQEFFWNGAMAIPSDIGTLKLEFDTFDSATMSYNINGETGSETIEFFEFDLSPTSNDLTGLWFPPSEPGRGLTVSTSGNTTATVLYSYDDNGYPLWMIGSLAKPIELGSEILIPIDFMTGYCLACSTVNLQAMRAGALKLTYQSRSNAQLVTENVASWQADIAIVPLSDVLDTDIGATHDPERQGSFDKCLDPKLVNLKGKIIDHNGLALPGATVNIVADTVITDANGNFDFKQLVRENTMLSVKASGQRTEYLPIYLNHPGKVCTITLDPVIMSAQKSDGVRMLFGGDVAFGRRFLDPENITPRDQVPADHPDALIQASDPEPGTRKTLEAIRPWYHEADYGVFNFETPITDNPVTPHQEKAFAFFTLPGSVPALKWLGIDYVSLGNNHTYDYLEQGLIDTLNHLDSNQLGYSGAGLNVPDAFKAHRATIGESTFGFLSMNSITGSEHSESYVADSSKGGSANLNNTRNVVASIQREVNNAIIPIVQIHMGNEYVFEPSEYSLNRMQLAADNNVPLVISHHPHVAQGVGIVGNTVSVLGLGNLAFDQARLETLMGVMARVDFKGDRVEQLRMLPVYLENYAPTPISGRLASSFIRRLSEFSHDYGGFVYPYNGQGWVALNDSKPILLKNTVTIDISIPEQGSSIVDLRSWAHNDESLLEINTDKSLTIQMGRDIFGHGDFEDWDVDQEQQEAARWDISGESRFICQETVYKGTNALCSTRSSSNLNDSVTANRNRVRVMGDALDVPNKSLSLFGYMKGDNAGAITIQTRYFASFGGKEFGEENAISHPGDTFDWQPFSAKLTMPEDVPVEKGQLPEAFNARALRMFIRHSPPDSGDAVLAIDEIAVINWENEITVGRQIQIPHAKDFLRVTGTPGKYQVTLTFGRHVPAALSR